MGQIITEEVLKVASCGNLSPLRNIPKVDLHAHARLSTPFEAAQALVSSIKEPPSNFLSFDAFMHYIANNYFDLYTKPDIVWRLNQACLDWMVQDGIIYTEISYDLNAPSKMGYSWHEFAEVLQQQISSCSGKLTVCCELGLNRETPEAFWKEELPQALDTGLFRSVDFYGNYSGGNIEEYLEFFEICQKHGLKMKVHSGELFESDRLKKDLSLIELEGVQHGITSVHCSNTLRLLSDSGIECNVCPTSNLTLAGIKNLQEHPIREMFDAGVNITLGTDDLAIFRSSLSEEYLKLYKTGVFSAKELEQIRQNGLQAFQKYKTKWLH